MNHTRPSSTCEYVQLAHSNVILSLTTSQEFKIKHRIVYVEIVLTTVTMSKVSVVQQDM
jgi:hypothetical protein